MTRILKTAVSFGLPLSLAISLSPLLFGRKWDWAILLSGFLTGMIIGVFYAIAMRYTMKNIGKTVVIDLSPGEHVLREGGSTYIKGKAGFPGRLMLTDKQLIFKSKKINDKDFEERIELSSIQSLKERNFWMGPGNDLMIGTNDERFYRFVVYAPEEWIKAISEKDL